MLERHIAYDLIGSMCGEGSILLQYMATFENGETTKSYIVAIDLDNEKENTVETWYYEWNNVNGVEWIDDKFEQN